MTHVAVVILNYNGEKLLPQFLPSVIRNSGNAQIIVADNASTDRSLEILRRDFPTVKIIALEKNFGFCGGYNRALHQVQADYYVLLNSDVEVTPGWLEPLTSLLDNNPDIACAQPKVLSYRERTQFEYAGAGGGFIDALGYPFCRGRLFNAVETDHGQYNDTREVFWTTGACFIVRAATFHHFEGFDEALFAHMEEIDLCWKINRTENRLMYCGSSVVYHLGAGTLGYNNPRKTFLNFRNGLILIFKHLNTGELIYKLPSRIALDWLAAFVFLVHGQGAGALAVLRAHFAFMGSIGSTIKKRTALRKRYPRYRTRNIFAGMIVIEFFLKRNKTISLR